MTIQVNLIFFDLMNSRLGLVVVLGIVNTEKLILSCG